MPSIGAAELQAMVDAAGTMIISCELDGTVRAFNPAAERLLGWRADEVVGRHTPALWHDAAEVAARAEELSRQLGRTVQPGFEVFVARGGESHPEQREWTFLRKDGGRFPVLLAVAARQDPRGRLNGYIGTALDLSARVDAEQQRDRFFDLALDLFCIASGDGFFKRVNPAFTRTLGWSSAELLSRPFLEFVHPDDRKATLREVDRLIVAGETVLHFENRYRHRNGSWRLLAWTSVPQPDGFLYATARDVTEQRRMEEKLRKSEQKLNITLNSIGDAVLATDDRGRITRMNPVAEKLTGWMQAEAVGRPVADVFRIIDEQTGGPAVIPVEDVLATGTVHGLANHTALIARDGTQRSIADSAAPIRGPRGRILGVVLVFRDVTQERRAAIQRTTELTETNARLREVSRAKSEFLAAMSHELRTPLNGILGMNELLLATELSTRQREFVEASLSSGKLLAQLINDVLDLSKIEAGALDLDEQVCSLDAIVYDVAGMFSPVARNRGLALHCRVAPELGVTVRCDDHRLRQVLTNLVGNALKFTSSGRVTIEVTRQGQQNGRVLGRFAVTDTGIGIPEERRHRLFQSFSQVDSSTTRRYGGTGLGLSICKQLVDLMGGRIGVESQIGTGSTFWFEIPLEIVDHDLSWHRQAKILRGTRVLTLASLDKERQQVAEHLHLWGCSVEQVSTLSDAMEGRVGGDGPPAVLLADLGLLEHGSDALERLAGSSRLPVIALGWSTDDAMRERLSRCGVRHVLRDPIRPSDLLDALVSVISSGDSDAADAAASPPPSHPLLSGHVLVAEDNHINQLYVVELLKYYGCTCDVAVNGGEALLALERRSYDLVLMDCQMPEMDGFTAAREIRRRQSVQQLPGRLPIVALTANALKGDRERCLEAGMDDYLGKPVESAALRAMLEKHLPQIVTDGTAE